MTPNTFQLKQGSIVVQFDDGASMAISGPAKFSVQSSNTATLTFGHAIARVPEEASGFVLRSAQAEAIDLGTEFSMTADPSGATEIHVLEGKVSEKNRIAKTDITFKLVSPPSANNA